MSQETRVRGAATPDSPENARDAGFGAVARETPPGAAGGGGRAPGDFGGGRLGLREAVALMNELGDSLSSCMRCGFCQEVCPVYGQSFREADLARGKLALLQDLGRELTSDAAAVDDRLNRCLLCGSCESVCPPGVGITEVFLRARAALTAYLGLGPAKRAIFRLVLPRPRLFSLLARLGAAFQGLFLKPESKMLGTYSMPLLEPLAGPRHVPGLPAKGFTASRGRILEPAGKSGLKALYFPGCVPDRLFPGVSEAALKVLKRHGVGVVMPQGLACCGIPAAASGDRKGFIGLLGHNLERLALDFDFLVTACATCASTIRETWPRFKAPFSGNKLELVERLSSRTYDLSSFLVNVVKADFPDRQGAAAGAAASAGGPSGPAGGRGGFSAAEDPASAYSPPSVSEAAGSVAEGSSVEGAGRGANGFPLAGDGGSPARARPRRVTYHDPCHLRRAMKVIEEPRKILKSLPGWEYVEMPEAGRCCGSGGSFSVLHPDLSEGIGMRKRGNIASVSPDVVATSCPACMIQLTDMLSRRGDGVAVKHFVELYAESLDEQGDGEGLGGGPARP
ncbi:MAG: (Fe-S)-binding protein, partial [Deltaproteobacteria bacterium]|nr:(Fe-S)-binding protein [Deltaproteobacteria bacterium]